MEYPTREQDQDRLSRLKGQRAALLENILATINADTDNPIGTIKEAEFWMELEMSIQQDLQNRWKSLDKQKPKHPNDERIEMLRGLFEKYHERESEISVIEGGLDNSAQGENYETENPGDTGRENSSHGTGSQPRDIKTETEKTLNILEERKNIVWSNSYNSFIQRKAYGDIVDDLKYLISLSHRLPATDLKKIIYPATCDDEIINTFLRANVLSKHGNNLRNTIKTYKSRICNGNKTGNKKINLVTTGNKSIL